MFVAHPAARCEGRGADDRSLGIHSMRALALFTLSPLSRSNVERTEQRAGKSKGTLACRTLICNGAISSASLQLRQVRRSRADRAEHGVAVAGSRLQVQSFAFVLRDGVEQTLPIGRLSRRHPIASDGVVACENFRHVKPKLKRQADCLATVLADMLYEVYLRGRGQSTQHREASIKSALEGDFGRSGAERARTCTFAPVVFSPPAVAPSPCPAAIHPTRFVISVT